MRLAAMRAVPFFRDLPIATLEALAGCLRPVGRAAGAVLFHGGEAGDTMYFVQSGRDGSSASLRRVSRWVRGCATGLVLSSGGSKAVAHIGVLRVLREMGVVIDAVAGTSGGAVAAAGFASGLDEAQMLERLQLLARSFQLRRFDFNLVPRTALSKGIRVRHLLDGAVVNPLPASVLRDAGIRRIIGSNVAGQDIRVELGPSGRVPNVLQIVARMMNSMEREMLKTQVPLVDIMIRPLVNTGYSFNFGRMREFIDEGARAARTEAGEALAALAS